MSVTEIPSSAFARGAVVTRRNGGPNMIVVRGYPDVTVAVLCEGDQDGTLRLKDFKTSDLEQLLPAKTPAT
jgi:uncharacterized protein YodC (DUF2158 family)